MKRLADGKGVLLEEPDYFGEKCFLAAASARFPELQKALKEDPGVHGAMWTLAKATMAAVAVADLARVHEVFAFLEDILKKPRLDPEIPNAIAASYVGISELSETAVGRSVVEQMPASIHNVISAGPFR
jgi:hypothetical protein